MPQRLTLTVLTPCLNEASTIEEIVRLSLREIKKLKITGEVLVVDNGSTDKSNQLARKEGARVVTIKSRGYGKALIYGIEKARGTYIFMLDSDASYHPSSLPRFWNKLKESKFEYDLIIGSRLKGRVEKGSMPFSHRHIGTPALTSILNFFFDTKISDCNCGMRLFKKTSIKNLGLVSSGMEFASEMILKSGILKLKIAEVPINFYKDKRKNGETHLRTFRDGWMHFKLLLSFAPNYFLILPGFLLGFIGSFLVLSQYRGPVILGKIVLDIHLMVLGVLLGFLGFGLIQMGLILEKDANLSGYPIGWLYKNFKRYLNLEKGIALGIIIMSFGFLFDYSILLKWASNNFRDIFEIRKAITATYLIYLGFQSIFFSMALSFVHKSSKFK